MTDATRVAPLVLERIFFCNDYKTELVTALEAAPNNIITMSASFGLLLTSPKRAQVAVRKRHLRENFYRISGLPKRAYEMGLYRWQIGSSTRVAQAFVR